MMDLKALQQEFSRIQTQGNNNGFLDNFLKLPDGEGSVIIRILPATEGLEGLPCAKTRTHKMNNKTFHSPLKVSGGKLLGNCPINNYYRSLWKQSDTQGLGESEVKALQAEARSIKPVERFYFNVIVRSMVGKSGENETNVGPKIYSCGKQVWDKILRAICGSPEIDEPGLGDITDLHAGRDFKIIKRLVKSGQDAYPNYNESKFLGVSPAGTEAEIERWMSGRHDLKSLINVKSYEELAREVRIHRGLEKDPDLSFDTTTMNEEPVTKVTQPTVHVETPKPTVKVKPPVADEDEDFGITDDFFNKLKGL